MREDVRRDFKLGGWRWARRGGVLNKCCMDLSSLRCEKSSLMVLVTVLLEGWNSNVRGMRSD